MAVHGVLNRGMGRAVRFLAALLGGLALLALLGYSVITSKTRDWFEADLALRCRLAVAAERESLQRYWRESPTKVKTALAKITSGERILGAAACSLQGERVAATAGYPSEFACESVLARWRQAASKPAADWATTREHRGGRVHLSLTLVEGPTEPLGAVILVHDLSYLDHREVITRNVLLVGFVILSLGASLVTFLAARFAWRGWTRELRRALTGKATQEFRPLIRDVRVLAERLAQERAQEAQAGTWSADRLRSTLTQHLQGERVVILANREPYIHEPDPHDSGQVRVLRPASGLVTALEPVMKACSGVWVAHGSGGADRQVVDESDRVLVPPSEESYSVRRVWLSEAEEDGYYYGFSNEGLWPLCHLAHMRPIFRARDYERYVQVNQKFAQAVCDEVDSDDPIVLVQDYHFALAPRMIRERLPRATIITFWHIPWPNAERIAICPWREELISGLLGSSVVGFHTQQHCNNFIDSVDAFMESRIDREANAVVQGERRTLIRPYPISIEWPVHWLKQVPTVEMSRDLVRRELGLEPNALLGIGVDRLDYTKGIEERFETVDELLTRYPEFRGRFTYVQLAAPSRTKIPLYRELNDRVEALAAQVNRKWSHDTYRPVILKSSHHEPVDVFRYYRAAELCYVGSLHDGMNLVAKEFVAARDDELGVLVLSQFTGASRELTEALIVNPYDIRQVSDAFAAGLQMPPQLQRERMRSMRRFVAEFNVYRWAGRMLVDAAALRRKERISGHLKTVSPSRNFER
jgi:trehalose 6-phosphate synthase